MSIGLGHYVFYFRTERDRNKFWGEGKWFLEHGSVLFLQEWKPCFQPFKPPKKPISLQKVCVHFSGLCAEVFSIKMIRSMAAALGKVIKIDTEAIDKGFGTFAKALVELDLKVEREFEVDVATSQGVISVGISYVELPLFCGFCDKLGHDTLSRAARARADGGVGNGDSPGGEPGESGNRDQGTGGTGSRGVIENQGTGGTGIGGLRQSGTGNGVENVGGAGAQFSGTVCTEVGVTVSRGTDAGVSESGGVLGVRGNGNRGLTGARGRNTNVVGIRRQRGGFTGVRELARPGQGFRPLENSSGLRDVDDDGFQTVLPRNNRRPGNN